MATDSPLSGKHILIAEDIFMVGAEIAAMIREDGAIAHGPIGEPEQVLAELDRQRFDGVLLDLQLRGGFTLRIARRLKQDGIPFVIVSGYGEEALTADLSGAPLITKPFNRGALVAAARRFFGRSS